MYKGWEIRNPRFPNPAWHLIGAQACSSLGHRQWTPGADQSSSRWNPFFVLDSRSEWHGRTIPAKWWLKTHRALPLHLKTQNHQHNATICSKYTRSQQTSVTPHQRRHLQSLVTSNRRLPPPGSLTEGDVTKSILWQLWRHRQPWSTSPFSGGWTCATGSNASSPNSSGQTHQGERSPRQIYCRIFYR